MKFSNWQNSEPLPAYVDKYLGCHRRNFFCPPPPNEIFFICTPQLRVCPRGNFAPLCWKILSSPLRRILFTPPFGSKSPSPTPKFAKKFSPTPENFSGQKSFPPPPPSRQHTCPRMPTPYTGKNGIIRTSRISISKRNWFHVKSEWQVHSVEIMEF